MYQKANRVSGEEYWLRCPYCGDTTKDQGKAHLSVNLTTGLYHCLRCKSSGRLTEKELLQVLSHVPGEWKARPTRDGDKEWEVLPGPASTRPTLLSRFHTWDDRDDRPWDVFIYRTMAGEETGALLKRKGQALTVGAGGLLYPDPIAGGGTIVRLVEGPYDVRYPEDVAVGGVLVPDRDVPRLAPLSVVLCPDGDVWTKPDLLKPFVKKLGKVLSNPALIGVEYVPDGLDPDEVAKEDRLFLDKTALAKLVNASTPSKSTKLQEVYNRVATY